MHLSKHYGKIETNVRDQYKSLEEIKNIFIRNDGVHVSKDDNTYYIFEKERIVETVTNVSDTSWKFLDSINRVKNSLSCTIQSSYTKIAIFDENQKIFDVDDEIFLLAFKLGSPKKPNEIISHLYEPELYSHLIVYFEEMNGISCTIHVSQSGSCRIVCSPTMGRNVQQCLLVAQTCHNVLKDFAA